MSDQKQTIESLKSNQKFTPVILNQEQINQELTGVVNQLREARKMRGLTRKQVCEDLGFSASQICKDEEYGKNISLAKLIKYSAYYQVTFTV